ncbi:MAG: hypothetical protein RIT28_3120 [Pseudomonadota bacterium]|jgi:hypothetical protein
MPVLLLIAALAGCGAKSHCEDRADDGDCDGVPDAADLCGATVLGPVDRQGCADNERAGCVVLAETPEDGDRVKDAALARWSGTCDVYLLQVSDDPDFPPGATRTVARTTGVSATLTPSAAEEGYWRVQGGVRGETASFSTPPRKIRWR